MFTNNRDFYPTPDQVSQQMCDEMNLVGKIVLEPHGGKGDLIKFLKSKGATVLTCEKDPELALIADRYADEFLKHDFFHLVKEEIGHVDYIIMNPPFSNQKKHIHHAWEILPNGAELITLCNYESFEDDRGWNKKGIKDLADEYGTYQNLGNVFNQAERKTNVDIGLVHLYSPNSKQENEWSDYLDDNEEFIMRDTEGIMQYNELVAVVESFKGACEKYRKVHEAKDELNKYFSSLGIPKEFTVEMRKEGSSVSYNEYKKNLQAVMWTRVFSYMKMEKYIDQKARTEINKFQKMSRNKPFTIRNIFKTIEMIYGTHSSRMDGVLLRVFDQCTKYYDDNRWYGKGWKTNSHYLVNKKFIIPNMCGADGNGNVKMNWSSNGEWINDFTKALCYLTGKNYDDFTTFYQYMNNGLIDDEDYYLTNFKFIGDCAKRYDNKLKSIYGEKRDQFLYENHSKEVFLQKQAKLAIKGKAEVKSHYQKFKRATWYRWGFFEFKGYNYGTIHFKFIDNEVWELFNRRIAKLKGMPLFEGGKEKRESL